MNMWIKKKTGETREETKVEFWLKIIPIMLVIAVAVATGLAVGRLAGGDVDVGNGARASGLVCEAVMAAENNGSNNTAVKSTDRGIDDRSCESRNDIEQQSELMSADGDDGVYDFKDNKATGTVTVTKEWNDKRTNRERPELNIKISTKKPSKSTLGYTVTFHGDMDDGLIFADGSCVNDIVYNSSGEIVVGSFKVPGQEGMLTGWYTDAEHKNKIEINENGLPAGGLSGDMDLYAKGKTFEIKGFSGDDNRKNNEFNYLIPDSVTSVIFTDEIKPTSASVIDVDADGDGGVVAWTEDNGTVMKISTQIADINVQAAKNSEYMLYGRKNIKYIDLTNLDTTNVTDMSNMLSGCSGLTNIDLSPLRMAKVTDMRYMFQGCSSLTSLDLSPLDTQNVTRMDYMFADCSGLTSLDLSPLDTSKVTNMHYMFYGCSGLTSLDLSPLDTSKVTSMGNMFYGCSSLTSLDLSPLNTAKVTSMRYMFAGCSGLTNLDLSPLNTANVTSMRYMFYDCSGLTSLDLSPLDTTKVTNMYSMFYGCSNLANLNLTSLNTANVSNMDSMFHGCRSLTNLDLTSFNTSNVTSMRYMFFNCYGLTNLDLTTFNTTNVTSMRYMFAGCSGLTKLDLTTFDTMNVTNMDSMFSDCFGLTSLKTGITFKFVETNYDIPGAWQNTAGEVFTSGNFPSNVDDIYTKV